MLLYCRRNHVVHEEFLIVFDIIDNFDIIETLFGSWAQKTPVSCVPSPGSAFAWATHYCSPPDPLSLGGNSYDNCDI